jgi:TRAP-type C4-dicarboxylate transport system substrate-binding protein
MLRRVIRAAALAAAALSLPLAASLSLVSPRDAHAQPVALRASSWLPPSHPLSQSQARWCAEVERVTAERVRCTLLARPVSAPPGTFDAVRDGLADLSFSVHGYTPGRYPLAQLAELPFSGDSAEAASVAYQRVFERHLAVMNEHRGLKVIAVFTHGPGQIFNARRPIASLADAKGLKFRVDGGSVNEVGKAIGATLVMKPSSESLELLTSGAVDGVFAPDESVSSMRLEKAIRYRTSVPGGLYNTSFAFVMNQDAWERIPKNDQAAIEQLSGEYAATLFARAWDQADRRGIGLMQATGVRTTVAGRAFVEELRARVAPLEQKWIAAARARQLPNPEQVLREFRAEVARLR